MPSNRVIKEPFGREPFCKGQRTALKETDKDETRRRTLEARESPTY